MLLAAWYANRVHWLAPTPSDVARESSALPARGAAGTRFGAPKTWMARSATVHDCGCIDIQTLGWNICWFAMPVGSIEQVIFIDDRFNVSETRRISPPNVSPRPCCACCAPYLVHA